MNRSEQSSADLVTYAAPAQGALAPGVTLANGTYEVEARLGSGGMGEVWRARNTITGALCAIKIIREDIIRDEFAVRLFKREASALKTVRDNAVAGYEGVFKDERNRVFLVMQFVEGPSLAEMMRTGPLGVDDIRRLMLRLARGLEAAHEVGVFHRDLSPDNVLIPQGRLENAVLIDFGIAKQEGQTIYAGQNMGFTGKFSYASPEQVGAVDAPVDQRSDIYSLGLVLAAAARGRPLPMGDDVSSAIAARRKPPDLGSLPRPLRLILAPLLMPDPGQRPRSMQEVASMASKPRDSARWIGMAGAGLLALAVLMAAWLMLREPAPPPALPELAASQSPTQEAPSIEEQAGSSEVSESATVPEQAGDAAEQSVPTTADDSALEATQDSAAVALTDPSAQAVENMAQPSGQEQPCAGLHCAATHEIESLVAPRAVDGLRIELSKADGHYSAARDVFIATVSGPPNLAGFLYVDYFHENGDVFHLLPEELTPENVVGPNGTIRVGSGPEAGATERVWRLSEPFGSGRIVAILSETPLYEGLRPIGESAQTYLEFLRSALVQPQGRMAFAEANIETGP
jgi:serine/threonine-protein kinase